MTDRNPPEKHCYGKVSYSTRAYAKAALKSQRRRLRDPDLQMYQCPTFGHWHLGHVRVKS